MAFRHVFFRRVLVGFRRASEGAIAVEFALAAAPLLAVLLFVADMAANYVTFQQIELTGQALIVQMRAGQIDPAAHSAQSFRDQFVCPSVPTLTCERVVVNLAGLASEGMISPDNVQATRWCSGEPREALLLQLAYPMPFLSRIWAGVLADSNRHYVASFALRNGPNVLAGAC
jgi:Flp pilus assembly protein TadG